MSAAGPPSTVQAPRPSEPHRQVRSKRRRRRVVAAAAAVVLLLAAAGAVIAVWRPFAIDITHPFGGPRPSKGGAAGHSASASLATVRMGHLSSQVSQSGTLGYAAGPGGSPYTVVNQATGTYTKLPSAGDVITCGQVLYRVMDEPVVLLCGHTPAYRSLSEGMSGPDVRELNKNLVRLGYATRSELDPSSDYFSSATADALEGLRDKRGVDGTGSLKLGQAVFLPGPLRISKTTATLGTMARSGGPVAEATSTNRRVRVDLDASQQSSVKVGDYVRITLPDNETTPGRVTSVGTVASSSDGSDSGTGSGSSSATIPVYITLRHPKDAGGLDQAPVQAQITTAGVKNALIVPITALLARAGGGYTVETVNAHGKHRLVPVTLGLFDDADGLVQVTNTKLTPGQRVEVPAI